MGSAALRTTAGAVSRKQIAHKVRKTPHRCDQDTKIVCKVWRQNYPRRRPDGIRNTLIRGACLPAS